MELATLMELRPIVGAGLFVTLTRRCPLSCAHCSTASAMDSEQLDAERLRRFVGSITPDTAPQVVFFTGGEPLLRPELLTELATLARAVGSATAVLTGGFFTRGGVISRRIGRALVACDHISFSLDAFHEREVDRAGVFDCLSQLLDHGRAVSLHLLGTGPDDPYLADVTAATRQRFGSRVPMLVSEIRPVGRAAAWLVGREILLDSRPRPCSLAAWPVVAFDGVILACSNQHVVDGRPLPEHLRLGHLDTDGWPDARWRLMNSPVLRMIRIAGPLHLQARFGAAGAHGNYCRTCWQLPDSPQVLAGAADLASGPVGALLDREVGLLQQRAGAAALVRRYCGSRYADLVNPAEAGA
jgi:pyruvate-formate lyase-activating enzyme